MPELRAWPLWELTRARLVEVVRQPGILFWVFGFPLVMAVLLGLAFRERPPEVIPVAVVDSSRAATAMEALAVPGLAPRRLSAAAATDSLRTGKVDLVVEAAGAGGWRTRYDPTRPTSRQARLEVEDALQRAAGRRDAVTVEGVEMREPGARYIDFLIPGLIGLNLMGSGMWGVGFVIVVMRTQKLLKRFAATPMRRSDFMLAILVSRLLLLAVEVAFLVLFGWLAFDVAVRGSWLALAVVSLFGAAAFTGLALLTAARAKTVETASGLMNAVMIPMWLVSGAFFSYERFPEALHPAIRALPLTAVNDALRRVINEGAPLFASATELGVLAAWAVVSFLVGLKVFRWQ